MEEVEERVSKLEAVLGRFIVQTDMMLKRMEQDTATFREEVRADQQARDKDMQQFRQEVRADQQARDKDMQQFRQEVRADQQARDKDMQQFREEMQADRHNLEQNLERVQREIQEDLQEYKVMSNKRWGELANRLGTVVEDIVAPNLPTIAQQYFGCTDIDFFGLRIKRKNQVAGKSALEFDAILVCSDYLIVNETKTKPDANDVKSFREGQLKKIFDYFPEYQEKTVVPIFSSLSFTEATLKYLTKNKIYAMSSKGDTMDLLNFEAIQKKK